MRNFLTQTAKSSELFIATARVDSLKARINNLQQSLDQFTESSQNIERQIADATQQYNALPDVNMIEQKRYELDQAKEEGSALEYRRQQIFQSYQDALSKKSQAEAQLKNSWDGINNTVQRLAYIQNRIADLDNIISSPRPQPQYSTTGGTCIHGHVNCPNLPIVNPGQTTLINAEEIAQYDRLVQSAIEERYKLLDERSNLIQQESTFRKEYSQAQNDLDDAQTEISQAEEQLQKFRDDITENRQLQEKLSLEFEHLRQERSNSQLSPENLQNIINNLRLQQTNINNQTDEVRNNLLRCELELQRVRDRIEQLKSEIEAETSDRIREIAEKEFQRQLQLEAIARREFAQQTGPGFFSSNNSTLENTSNDSSNQNNSSDAKSLVYELSDKLMDMGINAAHRAGAINQQVRENLRFIKNFGDKVSNDLYKQLEPEMSNHDNSDPPQNN